MLVLRSPWSLGWSSRGPWKSLHFGVLCEWPSLDDSKLLDLSRIVFIIEAPRAKPSKILGNYSPWIKIYAFGLCFIESLLVFFFSDQKPKDQPDRFVNRVSIRGLATAPRIKIVVSG